MKPILAVLGFMMLIAGAFAAPAPDQCQIDAILFAVIPLLVLCIILVILGKEIVSLVGVPDSLMGTAVMFILLAVGIVIIFGLILGNIMPSCVPQGGPN